MMAYTVLFFPAVLMTIILEWGQHKKMQWAHTLARYAISALTINLICQWIYVMAFQNSSPILLQLKQSADFLRNYTFMAVVVAIVLPLAFLLGRKIIRMWNVSEGFDKPRIGHACLIVYAVLLCLLHFARMGNYNYWGDEGYSIMLSHMSVPDMLMATAGDVHPPLYYLILQLVCFIIGNGYLAYNLTSLIPYVLFMILSVTMIRKKFGWECSAILITFGTLLDHAIKHNVEVRMYSWGLLFVFLSYMALYRILHENKNRDYIWFVVASLCAAYTHYYCLIIVAFFYLALIILTCFEPKKYFKPVALTCVATVAAYLPWLIVFIKTLLKVSRGFWIQEYISLHTLLAYPFSGTYKYILLVLLGVFVVVYLLRDMKLIAITQTGKAKLELPKRITELKFSMEAVWIVAGLCSVFGTMLIGLAVSNLVRPVLLTRYLYPAAVVAWLVLGVMISKLENKQIISLILVLLVVLSGSISYREVVSQEKEEMQLLENTLKATQAISTDDQILTTQSHIAWTIARHYYPDVSCNQISLNSITDLTGGTYWLIVSLPEAEMTVQILDANEFVYEEVVGYGNLGTHNVSIYKIICDQ